MSCLTCLKVKRYAHDKPEWFFYRFELSDKLLKAVLNSWRNDIVVFQSSTSCGLG